MEGLDCATSAGLPDGWAGALSLLGHFLAGDVASFVTDAALPLVNGYLWLGAILFGVPGLLATSTLIVLRIPGGGWSPWLQIWLLVVVLISAVSRHP